MTLLESQRSISEGGRRALDTLDGNRAAWGTVGTPPDRKHYPHIFLWDGALIATVRARYGDGAQAATEIREILRGQKANGMLPNMVFGPGRNHDPERKTFLDPKVSSDYTQPPIVAHAAYETVQALGDRDGKKFLGEVYPKLDAYYNYLQTTRTDTGSSLVAIIHPHETGRDSDPTFDFAKKRIPTPPQGMLIVRGAVDKLNSALDYAGALQINRQHKARNWDESRAREVFWVKDIMFNALYSQNLAHMSELSKKIGLFDEAVDYKARSEQVEHDILTHMWDEGSRAFYAVNKDGAMIRETSVSNLFPLILPHAPREKMEPLLDMLESPEWFGTPYPIPSVPVNSRKFDGTYSEKRLWRGPTWNNVTFMIMEGLLAQRDRVVAHDPDFARRLNEIGLRIAVPNKEMVSQEHREFNDPYTGKGMRVKNFAWATVGHLMGDRIPEMEEFAASI